MRSTQTTAMGNSLDLDSTLDQALHELPDIYRQAIILCHLEGCDHAAAARTLGCSINTLRSRLVRGRKRLRAILEQRGVTVSDGLLALGLTAILAETAQSAPLVHETLASCLQFAAGANAEAIASGSVAALVKIGLRGLLLSKTLIGTILFLGFGLGLGLLTAAAGWHPGRESSEEAVVRQAVSIRSAQIAKAKPLTDRFGDPLPEGAIQRLGTIRFRHGGKIESVAYSPDGKRLVTGGADAKVKIWERTTGKELLSFDGHSDDVHFVTFTPDGKYVISSSGAMNAGRNQKDPCTLKWEATTGKVALRFPGNKWNREMAALSLSADGKKLAACLSPELYIFDVETGQFLHTYPADNGNGLKLQFSPDGRNLAMLGMGQGVSLLEVATGQIRWSNEQIAGNITLHEPAASGLAFSPDGQHVAARVAPDRQMKLSGPVRILHAATGVEQSRFESEGIGPIIFGSNGKVVLTTTGAWDSKTGRQLASTNRTGRVFQMAISPDGSEMAEAAGIALLRLDPNSGKALPDSGVGHGTYSLLTVSADRQRLVALSYFDPHANVRGWNLNSYAEEYAPSGGTEFPVAVAPDCLAIAFGEYDKPGSVFRKKLGSWTDDTSLQNGRNTRAMALAYSRDGCQLFGVIAKPGADVSQFRAGGLIVKWDLTSQASAKEIGKVPDGSGIRCLAASPDKRLLAIGCWNKSIQIFDLANGNPTKPLLGQKGSIWGMGISPDSKLIAAVSGVGISNEKFKTVTGFHSGNGYDPTIRVWSLETGKIVHELPAPAEGSWSVAWSPDGKVLASGGEDAIVRIWDRDSGREQATLKGHAGPVTSLAFTPDGKRLLSGSTDTMILVWDMARLAPKGVKAPK